MNFGTLLRSALIGLGALSLASCGINSVPTAEENAKAKWADVEAAYQQRANLIPNIEAIVKGAASSEENILTGVTEARAKAGSVQLSADDLNDADKMEAYAQAQEQLGSGLSRLFATVEAYPDIKSNQNFTMAQKQVEGLESRVRIAIKDYNEAVRQYNTTIRTFPDTIGANIIHGAEPLVPYSAVTEGADETQVMDVGGN